jgi:di/tricarboxylate transporter
VFIRRSGPGHTRFTWLRVGLFFLAAGMWIGGVIVDNATVRVVAIVVLVAAFALRLAAGRGYEEADDEDFSAEEAGE